MAELPPGMEAWCEAAADETDADADRRLLLREALLEAMKNREGRDGALLVEAIRIALHLHRESYSTRNAEARRRLAAVQKREEQVIEREDNVLSREQECKKRDEETKRGEVEEMKAEMLDWKKEMNKTLTEVKGVCKGTDRVATSISEGVARLEKAQDLMAKNGLEVWESLHGPDPPKSMKASFDILVTKADTKAGFEDLSERQKEMIASCENTTKILTGPDVPNSMKVIFGALATKEEMTASFREVAKKEPVKAAFRALATKEEMEASFDKVAKKEQMKAGFGALPTKEEMKSSFCALPTKEEAKEGFGALATKKEIKSSFDAIPTKGDVKEGFDAVSKKQDATTTSLEEMKSSFGALAMTEDVASRFDAVSKKQDATTTSLEEMKSSFGALAMTEDVASRFDAVSKKQDATTTSLEKITTFLTGSEVPPAMKSRFDDLSSKAESVMKQTACWSAVDPPPMLKEALRSQCKDICDDLGKKFEDSLAKVQEGVGELSVEQGKVLKSCTETGVCLDEGGANRLKNISSNVERLMTLRTEDVSSLAPDTLARKDDVRELSEKVAEIERKKLDPVQEGLERMQMGVASMVKNSSGEPSLEKVLEACRAMDRPGVGAVARSEDGLRGMNAARRKGSEGAKAHVVGDGSAALRGNVSSKEATELRSTKKSTDVPEKPPPSGQRSTRSSDEAGGETGTPSTKSGMASSTPSSLATPDKTSSSSGTPSSSLLSESQNSSFSGTPSSSLLSESQNSSSSGTPSSSLLSEARNSRSSVEGLIGSSAQEIPGAPEEQETGEPAAGASKKRRRPEENEADEKNGLAELREANKRLRTGRGKESVEHMTKTVMELLQVRGRDGDRSFRQLPAAMQEDLREKVAVMADGGGVREGKWVEGCMHSKCKRWNVTHDGREQGEKKTKKSEDYACNECVKRKMPCIRQMYEALVLLPMADKDIEKGEGTEAGCGNGYWRSGRSGVELS